MGVRFVRAAFAGLLLSVSSTAMAADALKFGAPPAWVLPAKIPPSAGPASEAPIAMLLNDQQIRFAPGQRTTFSEVAIKIQTAQGLSAGNVSIPWDPATDTVTVNKLHILRGGQVIDVLANQTFTTIRREANLEVATLDGRLTATIQPEGLQEGDIVNFAVTQEHVDPVMKDHVETVFGMWNGIPTGLGRARLIWPTGMKLKLRQSAEMPKAKMLVRDGMNIAELSAENIQPLLPPASAPSRFLLGRIGEASTFESWSDIADLMIPLFRTAAVVPPSGPLRDEVERIRNGSGDAKSRTEKALALVQDRVRYVALLMGDGGYVPATAENTWSRRFGDCKGKTALLLAILSELGIEADAVVVHSALGDAIPERLPMLGQFNHVLVRARIGGKTYWLDGTRTGDTELDRLQAPNFRWGLPLVAKAELVSIVPPPLITPSSEQLIEIDARGGVYAPAAVSIEQVFRGDGAVMLNSLYAQVSGPQRDQALREGAKKHFEGITVKSSGVQFDKAKGELRLTIKGDAKLQWDDGWYYVPSSSIGYNPDFDRAAGPLHDAPFAIAYPDYEKRRVTIQLPRGFAAGQKRIPVAVKETLAGVEYARTVTINGDVVTVDASERSIAAEVPYKDALAAAGRLKTISNDDLHLRIPDAFRPTDSDVAALQAERPTSAAELVRRGHLLMDKGKFDEAIADFNEALKLDPKNAFALANRAVSMVWKRDYESAERDLQSLRALDPANAVGWRAEGLMNEHKGKFQEAVNAYTEALKIEPANSFALGHRAYAHNGLGQQDKALIDSEAALKVEPTWMDLRIMRANIFVRKGDREGAAKEAETVIAENPQSDFAYVAAARIYTRIGRKDEATKAFDRAIAIKPAAYVYLNRAQSRPQSDMAGRLADLDAALKLEPDNPDVLATKAGMLSREGKHDEAVQLYDRALAKAPEHVPYIAAGRAVALSKAGRMAEAEKAYAEIRSRANTANEFNNLCWTKATANILLESALQDCREALKREPEAGPFLDSLGMVMLRLGNLDEALAAYDKAVAKKTGSASLMGRALVYSRKGDKARAEADRAEALKLDPDAETRFAEYGLKL